MKKKVVGSVKKAPKKVGAVKKVVKKAPLFTIKITTEHADYTGEGLTALDALKAVPMPDPITSATLVIAHGEKSKEMLFSGMQLKRLLNPYNMDVLINDLQIGME